MILVRLFVCLFVCLFVAVFAFLIIESKRDPKLKSSDAERLPDIFFLFFLFVCFFFFL